MKPDNINRFTLRTHLFLSYQELTRSWSKNRIDVSYVFWIRQGQTELEHREGRAGENVLSNMMANMPLRILTLQQRFSLLSSRFSTGERRSCRWRAVCSALLWHLQFDWCSNFEVWFQATGNIISTFLLLSRPSSAASTCIPAYWATLNRLFTSWELLKMPVWFEGLGV